MRNLTKTLAVVSILAPASAYPLGIGDIKLHSALNQNLNAEIALVVSPGEDISDIKVSLAPPAKFDEAGVAWSYFLSKIKFEPIVKSNGAVVIKLSSNEALKEPFLDFLLQVSWPKGNLFREFTVLVDPPAVYKQPTIPVQSAPESDSQESAYVPEPKSASPQYRQQAEPEPGPEDNGVDESEAPQARASDSTVVTTRKNDTLWGVADPASRQKNVSVEQMMMAIYDKNPHAFYKKNVNALLAGKRLKIPGRQTALRLSRRQALAEFNRQQKVWNRQSVPKKTESEYAHDDQVEKQLQLVAPTEAEVGENAVVTPGVDKTPAPTAEKTPAQTAEIQAIQNKVAELEKQLAVMQQLVALKDQQLAALQNQTSGAAKLVDQEKPIPPANSEVKTPATTEPAPATTPAEPVPTVASQPPVQPQAAAQPPVVPPALQPAPAQNATPEPALPTAEVKPPEPPVVSEQPEVKAAETKPAPSAQAEPETDYYYLTVAGLGTVALSLLGWLWWRKRKVEEETDADSMFASSSVIIVPEADENIAQTNNSKTLYDVGTLGESSFLSEFTTSDFDVFDTAHGDIDPISEADVYLAYGRYQQAEELIRQAIKDQPNDNECKLKLLEIFYANENKTAFEAYAKELADAGKNFEVDFWAKVSDMGKDICPASTLFTTGGGEASASSQSLASNKVSISKVETPAESKPSYFDDLDTPDDFGQELASAAIASTQKIDPEFDIEEFDFSSAASFDDVPSNNDSIEFDLGSFAEAKPATEAPQNFADVDADDIETFAFDFDLEAKPAENKPAAKLDLNKSLDDAHEFHNLDQEAVASSQAIDVKEESFDNDFDFDFNFDFDAATFASNSKEPKQEDNFEVMDLADMDEFETKLDLAKAYIDMGDVVAAREIANEVLAKGSSEQKKSAQSLLDELE